MGKDFEAHQPSNPANRATHLDNKRDQDQLVGDLQAETLKLDFGLQRPPLHRCPLSEQNHHHNLDLLTTEKSTMTSLSPRQSSL